MADAAAKLGRWADAARALERAAGLNPADPLVASKLGSALWKLGRFEEALRSLKGAVALDPDNVQTRLTYADLLIDTGRYSDALMEIEVGSRLALARALGDGQQGGTVDVGDNPAFSISRENVAAVRELGLLLDRSNQLDGLRQLLAAAEKAGIETGSLGYLEASVALRDGRAEDAKRLLLNDRGNIDDVRWYRLSTRIEEALGNADEAFAAAEKMNRSVAHYNEWRARGARYRRNIRVTARVVTPEWASRIPPLSAVEGVRTPVFLVGFPRSGTTLLDTFLMGHPETCVVEEGRMLEKATGVISQAPHVEWSAELLERARKAYLEELSCHVPPRFSGLIVDKHPLNMLRLSVIYALFPDAKVIFAQRHPCDVVLSGYMQGFALNPAMASFLDLGDAADFYDAAMTIWVGSRDAFSQSIHTVGYERLIAEPVSELRPAFQFLGLDWSDELLDHQSTARSRGSITTASYDQVLQPLSRTPSGRWRRYRKQLAPVLPVLLPWAERLGYVD
jgi:tetratricopeptide (TPR) repeat protein